MRLTEGSQYPDLPTLSADQASSVGTSGIPVSSAAVAAVVAAAIGPAETATKREESLPTCNPSPVSPVVGAQAPSQPACPSSASPLAILTEVDADSERMASMESALSRILTDFSPIRSAYQRLAQLARSQQEMLTRLHAELASEHRRANALAADLDAERCRSAALAARLSECETKPAFADSAKEHPTPPSAVQLEVAAASASSNTHTMSQYESAGNDTVNETQRHTTPLCRASCGHTSVGARLSRRGLPPTQQSLVAANHSRSVLTPRTTVSDAMSSTSPVGPTVLTAPSRSNRLRSTAAEMPEGRTEEGKLSATSRPDVSVSSEGHAERFRIVHDSSKT